MITPEELGRRLKVRREYMGISQAELGRRVGNLDQSIISDLERGRRRMTVMELLKFAEVLDVHAFNYFLIDTLVPNPDSEQLPTTKELEMTLLNIFRRLPNNNIRMAILNLLLSIAPNPDD